MFGLACLEFSNETWENLSYGRHIFLAFKKFLLAFFNVCVVSQVALLKNLD